MVSLVNSHTDATTIGWHLWEIDLRLALDLPPGWPALSKKAQRDFRRTGKVWRCVAAEPTCYRLRQCSQQCREPQAVLNPHAHPSTRHPDCRRITCLKSLPPFPSSLSCMPWSRVSQRMISGAPSAFGQSLARENRALHKGDKSLLKQSGRGEP